MNAWTVRNLGSGQTKPEIRFIPALVKFLGYDPEPVEERTFAGRLVAKRRELGCLPPEAARSLGIDPGTWAGWELREGSEGRRIGGLWRGFWAQTRASGGSENGGAARL